MKGYYLVINKNLIKIADASFKEAVSIVFDDQNLLSPLKLKTITKEICEPKESDFKSKVTKWGITNEPNARKISIQLMKNKLQGLQVNKRRLCFCILSFHRS